MLSLAIKFCKRLYEFFCSSCRLSLFGVMLPVYQFRSMLVVLTPVSHPSVFVGTGVGRSYFFFNRRNVYSDIQLVTG